MTKDKLKAPASQSIATRGLQAGGELRAAVENSAAPAQLQSKLRKITVDGQEFYVAEGDTLLDPDQLAIYAVARSKQNEAFRAASLADSAGLGTQRLNAGSRGLIALTQGGKIVKWAPGTVLTYRVIKNTFTVAGWYEKVVANMKAATEEWENTCGVKFEYKQALDGAAGVGTEGAVFAVRQIDAGGAFIASSFFPNDPTDRRRLLIDLTYYDTDFDNVGVLRHELGHILGFRHEHINPSAPLACKGESDFDSLPLTAYDNVSVMHYFCGGVGSKTLSISALDRVGAQQVYGPPLSGTSFIGV